MTRPSTTRHRTRVALLTAGATLLAALAAPATTAAAAAPAPQPTPTPSPDVAAGRHDHLSRHVTTLPAPGGRAYHVDCSARPGRSGTGSLLRPLRSLDEVNRLNLRPGDAVLLKRGSRCTESLAPRGSGTAARPIRIGAYGIGPAPTLDAPRTADSPAALTLRNQSHWRVADLEITGGYWQGVSISAHGPDTTVRGIELHHLHVHDNGWVGPFNMWVVGAGGIVAQPCSTTASVRDVTVSDSHVHNNHITGIQLGYHHHAAYDPASPGYDGQEVPGCHMDLPAGATAPKTGLVGGVIVNTSSHDNDASGAQVFGATDVLLRHNDLYRNGSGSKDAVANPSAMNGEGAWWDSTLRVTAEWNNAWGNREGHTGNDGCGLDADRDTDGTVIQYNYLHDNANYGASIIAGHDWSDDAIIRYNVMSNNGTRFPNAPDIMVSRPYRQGGVGDLLIHNNTLTRRSGGQGIRLQSPFKDGATVTITNNVIQRGETFEAVSATTAQAATAHNLYWAGGAPVKQWYVSTMYTSLRDVQSRLGKEVGSLTADPQLRDPFWHGDTWPRHQFTPAATSPAKRLGARVPGFSGTDIRGLPVWPRHAPSAGAVN